MNFAEFPYIIEVRREEALHYANILLLQKKGSFAVTTDSKKLGFVNFWMSENTKKILELY